MKKNILFLIILFNVLTIQAQKNSFDIVLAKADSIFKLGEYMYAIRMYDNASRLQISQEQREIITKRKYRTYTSIDSMIFVVQDSKKQNKNIRNNMEIAIFSNAVSENKKENYWHGVLTENIDTLDLSNSNITYLSTQVADCKRLKSINLTGNPNLDIDSAFAIMQHLKLLTDIKIVIDSIQQIPIGYNHKITGLEIRQQGITQLDPMIIRYKNLTYLDISGTADSTNNFTNFPEIIYYFKKLQYLDMNYCQIDTIPDEIQQLENLKILSLENNNITELPDSLQKLENITQLRLNDNKFSDFPLVITKLKKLRILGLHNNHITKLPKEIGNLNNLTLLYIWNNQITVIPPQIGKLTELIDFRLHNNKTKSIPEEISNLQNLVYLSLSYNNLATLPTGIWKLKKLKFLWLHENQLTAIPEQIAGLENLVELDAGNNKITALPKSIGQLQDIKVLSLENNNIKTLPEEITQLQTLSELNIENNKITELPIGMLEMNNLQYVYTENNEFTEAEIEKNKEMFGADEYCKWLGKNTGQTCRLPSEAEWEYAAQGGNVSKNKYAGTNKQNELKNYAWYSSNSSNKTHQVGTKKPNELGIYDMSGNVWEWCSDWYSDYSSGNQTDPKGSENGMNRVDKAGSWFYDDNRCIISHRSYNEPNNSSNILGFRLVYIP